MCVVCADKKEKIPEKIQIQCRSVLIENNFFISLFVTLRFSLDYFTGCSNGYQSQQLDLIPEHMRDNFQSNFHNFSLTKNLQKSSITLQSKIEILNSFLGTLRGDYFRQAKTAAQKEKRNRRIDLQHGASEHCSSWEVGSRNFEPPPTAEPD
jgi:hypothetical protein